MAVAGLELATFWLRVLHPNHCAITAGYLILPQFHEILKLSFLFDTDSKSAISLPATWKCIIPWEELIVLVCASQAGAVESTTMAYANNATDFALKLFAEITKQPDATNVFFSPYSISTAMAMLYIGSDGDTKAQLARVMGYPTDMAAALGAARNLQRDVFIESEDYELEAANTLFVNEGYDVLDEYTVRPNKIIPLFPVSRRP